MTPKQLRQLADDIEKGNADARYHIQVDTEQPDKYVGADYMGTRVIGRQFVTSKIVIEVICYTDVCIQEPGCGKWITLRST